MKRRTLLDTDKDSSKSQIKALVRDVEPLLKSQTWEKQIGEGVTHLTLEDEDDVLKEIPRTVSRMPGLWAFTLINRKVKTIPDHLLSSDICELSFQNCPIKSIDGIQRMFELRALELYNNNVQKLPGDIGNLAELQQFSVTQNSLKSIPASIGRLQNLRRLILCANSLTEVPASLCDLKQLTHLDLSHNRLRRLPDRLGDLKNLDTIVLTDNQLTELPASADRLLRLTHLMLGFNKLSAVPNQINKMAELQMLNLTSNRVTDMAASNRTMTAFILDKNALREIPHSVFLCEQLQKLSLKNNLISELPDLISRLEQLRVLHLDGNPLTKLPDDICLLHRLKELTLRETRLTDLPMYFDSLEKLCSLDLDQTEIGFTFRNALKMGGIPMLLSEVAQRREQINEQARVKEKRLSSAILHQPAQTSLRTNPKPKPKTPSISGKDPVITERQRESFCGQTHLTVSNDIFIDPTRTPHSREQNVSDSRRLDPFMEED